MKNVIIYSALMVLLGALLFAQYNNEINVPQSLEEKTNQETLTNETSETNNNNQTISISEVFKIQLKEIDEEVPKEYELFKEYFDRYFSNDIAINDFLISSGVATDRIETNILNTNTKETNENQKEVIIEDIDKIEFKVLPEDIEDIIKEEIENKRKFRKLEKQPLAIEIESAETKIYASGDITFGISFGSVRKTPDLKTPISSFIKENFNVDQDMKIRSTSKIGNKVDVDIEFDQKSAINKFNVSYKEPETQDLPQQPKERV